jgi:hypothetical protein
MKYTIGGTITNVTEPRIVKTNKGATFYSQDIWLAFRDESNRDQIVAFEVFQKEPVSDDYRGSEVEIQFSIEGREYVSKKDGKPGVFNKIKARNIQFREAAAHQRREEPEASEGDDVPW